MKYGIPTAIAITLLAGSLAQAQTTTNTSPNTAAPAMTAAPAPGSTGNNGGGLGASALNPNRTGTTTAPAAVTTTSAMSRTTAAPVPGANSFTAGEARKRIEDRGFSQINGLKKDEQGIWRATAMKDGKSTTVALDYQGNIVAQ